MLETIQRIEFVSNKYLAKSAESVTAKKDSALLGIVLYKIF